MLAVLFADRRPQDHLRLFGDDIRLVGVDAVLPKVKGTNPFGVPRAKIQNSSVSMSPEAMVERIKESWHLCASSRAGLRFRERYHLHQSRSRRRRRRGRFDLVRLSYVIGGVVLVVVSALFGWLPVLGWGTALLGFGMIAAEFYQVARLMDWLEEKSQEDLQSAREDLRELAHLGAALPLFMTSAASSFVLVYGVYSSLSWGG